MELDGQLHASGTLLLGTSHRYRSNRRLSGPQIPSGWFGQEKYPLHVPEIKLRFLRRPSRSLVTILTELFKLREHKATKSSSRTQVIKTRRDDDEYSDCNNNNNRKRQGRVHKVQLTVILQATAQTANRLHTCIIIFHVQEYYIAKKTKF